MTRRMFELLPVRCCPSLTRSADRKRYNIGFGPNRQPASTLSQVSKLPFDRFLPDAQRVA